MLLLTLLLNALLLLYKTEAGEPVEAGPGLGGGITDNIKKKGESRISQDQT